MIPEKGISSPRIKDIQENKTQVGKMKPGLALASKVLKMTSAGIV